MGEFFPDTPMVLPIRGCLDDIKRVMVGDFYKGRGCRQRGLGKSEFCNDFKVAVQLCCGKAFFRPCTTEPTLEAVRASTRVSLQTFSSVPRRRHHPEVQSQVLQSVQQGRDGRSGCIFHGVELHVAVARRA